VALTRGFPKISSGFEIGVSERDDKDGYYASANHLNKLLDTDQVQESSLDAYLK
jgi:hypothetical protein